MKVLAINGSQKGKNSATHILIQTLFDGMKQAGAKTQEILLSEKNIQKCQGCHHCWQTTETICSRDDDMNELIKLMERSDIVIYSTPVHSDNISAHLKIFIDRLSVASSPYIVKNNKGEYIHGYIDDLTPRIQGPKMVVLANSGLPGEDQFVILKLLFKRMSRHLNTNFIAQIYRDQGPLFVERNPSPYLKTRINEYKKILVQAGKEIIKENQISKSTQKKLKEPIIPTQIYIDECNKYYQETLNSK